MVLQIPKDDRDWPVWHASLKDVSGKPDIPADRSGYREERDGSDVSHRLKVTAEGIRVNVGGLRAEVSSPPMNHVSVGAAIVLGARESRVHGEGRQGIDVVLVQ